MFLHDLIGVMVSEHQRHYYKLTLGKKTEPSCHPAALNIYIERTLICISYSHSLEIFLFECDLRTHHLNIQKISS